MQARVTCPACQTQLAVNAAHGSSTLLRCPKCRHEFAVRLRQQPSPAGWPANDPFAGTPSAPLPQYSPLHNELPAPRPIQQAMRPAAEEPSAGSGASLLWIGIGAGAALAVVCVVLVAIVLRMTEPGRDDAANSVAVVGADQGQSDSQPLLSGPVVTRTAPGATAPNAPAPSAPVATPGQPVSTVPLPSPLSPSPAPSPDVAAPTLAYRFNAGEEFAYVVTIKANVAGADEVTTGLCSLALSREASPPEFAAQEKTGEGSGSGFVVTSDGYLVTCAHCVEGSTKIEAIIAGQTYPAQVIAFDKPHDLAVIRIVAVGLPTIQLGNSDAVEQAQEVRAVGYPLSTVLGESVKITRGTIAGIVNNSGRKLFQVDASINPGNSGGPLVNEMGQVVGVASAKLAGEDVDGVGFAVPANEVLNLLRRKGISLSAASGGSKLDGPALARRVTPAVALLKITIGPGGYGTGSRLVVDCSGNVFSQGKPQSVGPVPMPGSSNTGSERGKLLVTDRGELLNATAMVQLPYLLGPLGAAFIEPLGSGDERTWQTQQVTALTQATTEQNNGPISLRFRRRGRSPFTASPFASQTKIVVTPALETTSYELTGESGDTVTIVKRYNFQTLPQSVNPPVAKMTGEGTITFNRAKGYAEKMNFSATLVRSVNNASVTVPLSVEWHRITPGELGALRVKGFTGAP
jgi:S1-C subfamily serine protease